MRSIEKMRDELRICETCGSRPTIAAMANYADEIEHEIAERYMELPVDVDGVPWHLGDITENGNRINGMVFDSKGWYFTNTLNDIDPSIHHHAKQRTIEDVLKEVMAETQLAVNPNYEIVARYAAELRELTGGDA